MSADVLALESMMSSDDPQARQILENCQGKIDLYNARNEISPSKFATNPIVERAVKPPAIL